MKILGFASGLVLAVTVASAQGEDAAARDICSFDTSRETTAAGRYPESMVVEGEGDFDGSFESAVDYLAGDGRFKVALWESGPGTLRTESYPHDEYCLVLEGELVVTNASGTSETFGPGDTFVIPRGWAGTWDMKTRFRKQYVAFGEVMPER